MRYTALLFAGTTLLAACGGERSATEPSTQLQADASANSALGPDVQQDIAALRIATAQLHDLDAAKSAGYDTQFPPGCFTSPAGGMGFHFIKGPNVGTLDVTRPQLVMYEPEKNGQMRLVGVEFIYPGVPTDDPPRLFGRSFRYNYTFSVWALHVWAWKDNPSGIFADWNPTVTCEFAPAGTAMTHH